MASVPTGTIFSLATVFAAAKTVTAITNAAEAVASCTAHGLEIGNTVVVLSGWSRLNRRAFHAALNEMLASSRASGEALSCVMVDIDHFKSVNDTHGHAIGDRVIQEVAKKLVASARASDLVCRYGGEEFCVVLHGSTLAAAQEFGERVRRRIEAECGMAVREVPGMRVTASLGLAVLSDAQTPAPKLIDQADQALYRAKRGGRNRVCAYATASESESAPAPDPASSDRSGTTASQHGADCPTTEGVVA